MKRINYECPTCGLNQRYSNPGAHFCPNDSSLMLPIREDGSIGFSTMKNKRIIRFEDGENSSIKRKLAIAAIAGTGMVAGGVMGARTLPRMIRRGRLAAAGESLTGKVLYTHEGVTTPLETLHIGGKSVQRHLFKTARNGGFKGKVAEAILKADNFIGIPQRHYGVGVGAGRVVEKTKAHAMQTVSERGFARDKKIHVDSEVPLKTEKDIDAFNQRYEQEAAGLNKKEPLNFISNNCEHQSRFLAGQGRKSYQAQAIIGGALGGGLIGGGATGLVAHKLTDGNGSQMKDKRITKLSARQTLIELARGKYIDQALAGTGYLDPASPESRILEAVKYRPGSFEKDGSPTASAPIKKIRDDVAVGSITPKVGAARIKKHWETNAPVRARAIAEEMKKADIDTNVSGKHGLLHKELADIRSEASSAAEEARIGNAGKEEVKRILKAGETDAADYDSKYKARAMRQGIQRYKIKRPDGRADYVSADEFIAHKAQHSTKKAQKRLIKGIQRAEGEARGLTKADLASLTSDRKQYSGGVASAAREEQNLMRTMRAQFHGTDKQVAFKKISKDKWEVKGKIKGLKPSEVGIPERAAAKKATNQVLREIAPEIRGRLQTAAEEKVTARASRYGNALRRRSEKLERESLLKGYKEQGVSGGPSLEVVQREAEKNTQAIRGTNPDMRTWTEADSAKRLGMTTERHARAAETYRKLTKESDVLASKAVGRMVKDPVAVKKALRLTAASQDVTGSMRSAPSRIGRDFLSIFAKAPKPEAGEIFTSEAARKAAERTRSLAGGSMKRADQMIAGMRKLRTPAAIAGGVGLLGGGAAYAIAKRKKKEETQMSSALRLVELAVNKKLARSARNTAKNVAQKAINSVTGKVTPIAHGADATLADASESIANYHAANRAIEKTNALDLITPQPQSYRSRYKMARRVNSVRRMRQKTAEKIATDLNESHNVLAQKTREAEERAIAAKQYADVRVADIQKAGEAEISRTKRVLGKRIERGNDLRKSAVAEERRVGNQKAWIAGGGAAAVGTTGGIVIGWKRKDDVKQFAVKEDPNGVYKSAGKMGASAGATAAGIAMVLGLAKGGRGKIFRKGLIPGTRLINATKSAGISAGLAGSFGAGSALVGSHVLGAPKPDENGAYTKRGAIGGAIVGTAAGALLGAASLKNKWVRDKVAHYASDGWRPVQALQRQGMLGRTLTGAAVGGIFGGAHIADEGMQVDALLGEKKKPKINRLSSRMKTIKLSSRLPVAADRYRKKIAQDEDNRHEKDMLRSAVAGGGLGYLLKNKMPLNRSGAILAGMGAGILTQAGMRALTRSQRDQFGDMPLNTKKIETIPWKAGALASAGILGARAYRGMKMFSRKGNIIQFGITADVSDYGARAIINQRKLDNMDKEKERAWNRAKRESNSVRRTVSRSTSLIGDLGLKMRGEKKLDERGRERKNEWDKSWVRNAAVGAALTGVALVGHRAGANILKEAADQRKAGVAVGEGLGGLYNSVRGLVKRDVAGKKAGTLVGTGFYKAIRDNRRISRPIIRMRRSLLQANKEASTLMNRNVNSLRAKVDDFSGKTAIDHTAVGEVVRTQGATLDKVRQEKAAATAAAKDRLLKIKNAKATLGMSSRVRPITFATETEIVPVGEHYRSRRKKKSEMEKPTVYQEREAGKRNALLLGLAGLGSGGAATAAWDRFSPNAVKMRNAANLNEEQITEAVDRRVSERFGEHPDQIQKRVSVANKLAQEAKRTRYPSKVVRLLKKLAA